MVMGKVSVHASPNNVICIGHRFASGILPQCSIYWSALIMDSLNILSIHVIAKPSSLPWVHHLLLYPIFIFNIWLCVALNIVICVWYQNKIHPRHIRNLYKLDNAIRSGYNLSGWKGNRKCRDLWLESVFFFFLHLICFWHVVNFIFI